MAGGGASARIAGAAAFVSMADGGASARIAGAAAFVSMADGGACARIAGAAAALRVPCASETGLGLRVYNHVSGQLQALANELLTVSWLWGGREREFIEDNDAQDMNECDLAPSAQAHA